MVATNTGWRLMTNEAADIHAVLRVQITALNTN